MGRQYRIILVFLLVALVICGLYFIAPFFLSTTYTVSSGGALVLNPPTKTTAPENVSLQHLKTPSQVKAIYMSSWVAATPSIRDRLVKLADETEINAIVIDIKDYTGRIAFSVEDPTLQAFGSSDSRIKDLRDFIRILHEKNIYVIGRIAAFQDPFLVRARPELAVKRASDGAIWKDRKGISWIDAGSKDAWDYLVLIAKESWNAGFDELNFDYVRFPSDGNMQDISFPSSGTRPKPEVLKQFFAYLADHMEGTDAVLSADLFGLTTTAADDLGIGQVLLNALPYFDYVAPMVYPSHYAAGFDGYANPAAHPYEVVKRALDGAVVKITAASTTPRFSGGTISTNQIRPWLQDFDLGADYTPSMVRGQITATYDAGLSSWMLWDPNNRYTPEALNK